MESGILAVDKPEGTFTTELVRTVKKVLAVRKVGHLGSLDPFASGLILLGINEGTKIAEIFLTASKSYVGTVQLGVETDTQDPTGKVLAVREVPRLDEKALEDLRSAFTGTLWQVPPMFSAVKKNGIRLYRLARQGKNVDRPARQVKIQKLRVWSAAATELGFEVTCSKGTYVRALASDMGKYLGCGAHLKSLRRVSCGHLTLAEALLLDEIRRLGEKGELRLISLNQSLKHLRAVTLEQRDLERLVQGQQDVLARLPPPQEDESWIRLVSPVGDLTALARWAEGETARGWRLFRILGRPQAG